MQNYRVSCKDYYEIFEKDSLFVKFRDICKNTMMQLINKYEIKNKKILSIGAGMGYEEYWFAENNCSLTLIDIDEHRIIEPKLKNISKNVQIEATLNYLVGDANEYFEIDNRKKFDVIYFSSFTPDELRRRECTLGLLKRILLHHYWPKNKNPFIDTVIKSIQDLNKEGLFIMQSYAGGNIYVHKDSNYISCVKQQLFSAGIELLTIYYFDTAPRIHLIIGYKGSKSSALKFLKNIENNPEISNFHGRSEVKRNIKIAYKLTEYT